MKKNHFLLPRFLKLLVSYKQSIKQRPFKGLDLIAFVSHELKNPLSTLKLNTELIKKQAFPEQKKAINIMEEEINWMIQFISDTLDLSQIEQKKLFRPRQHNWHLWIESVKHLIEKQTKLWNNPIHWSGPPNKTTTNQQNKLNHQINKQNLPTNKNHSQIDKGLVSNPKEEDIKIFIDPLYMKQALLNLIINAMEHSPPHSPVECLWHKTPNHHLKVCVIDQGKGIAKNDLKTIFEPFQKSHPNLNKKIKSSGLGLHITKKIIEAHRGQIYAKNRTNGHKGAMFVFTLPLWST